MQSSSYRINNHLKEIVIVNVRSRHSLIILNDLNLYDLVGIEIAPKSSIELELNADSVLYFSNVPGTKVASVSVEYLDNKVINLWNHESDVIQCNHDSVCRTEDNVILKTQLANHIIWYVYSKTTYLIISIIIALLFVAITIAIITPIKK